jgi:8-oxo-dGTP pyrophosphatase MutT (NUDIX family)
MGGAYVFPGGKLDPADADPSVPADLDDATAAGRLGEDDGARARALHVAAARECLEEAGVLFVDGAVDAHVVAALRHACDVEKKPLGPMLIERGLSLRLRALVPWTRWITPRVESRRFDARFFVAVAPAGVDATHDTRETVASLWLTPREALARAHREEIVLVPPTYRSVEVLAQQPDVAHVLAMPPAAIPTLEPVVVPGPDGGVVVALPGDPLHPLSLQPMTAEGRVDSSRLATRFLYDGGAWRAETHRKSAE